MNRIDQVLICIIEKLVLMVLMILYKENHVFLFWNGLSLIEKKAVVHLLP